jgi:TolB-like protein/Tfp pilus assembly protein PilF
VTDFTQQLQHALGQTYTIERELGGGGMSRVFVATENALGRQVVIKLLSSAMGVDLSAERFEREIRLAAGLQHPCIVPVLTAGAADGVPFYTMPLIVGHTLRERMAEQERLPLDEALGVLRDLASALGHAHARGIVHRDIKPENILISGGYAQVTDFGIARAISESRTQVSPAHKPLTQTGMVIGTPAYMAPEQASGDGAMDQRADIYAFGCLAYELLSGAPPFAGRSPHMTLMAHVSETPVPLRTHRPDLPPELALLVMRCLAKDPANRPQSAEDLLNVLRSPLAISQTAPRPAARAPQVSKPQPATSRRVPRWALYMTAVTVIALAGVAVFAFRTDAARATPASVAVLPFTNVGGDSAQEYFSDGITDDLTSALAEIPGLRVAPRRSAFAFKGRSADARDIGRQLDVSDVLEGSVRRTGNGLRVNAELVRASDGTASWRKTFDRSASDLFAVQDEITRSIAGELHIKLRPVANSASALAPHTPSLAAHDLYSRGEYLLNQNTEASLPRAIDYFKQAVALDSTYAQAYVGIAQAYSYLADSFASAADTYPDAIAAARRAVALDSNSADAHALLGLDVLEFGGDWAQAKAQLDAAIRLEPDSPNAYRDLSFYEAAMRRPRRAVANAQRALALDPSSAANSRLVETWWLTAHEPDSAIAQHRHTQTLSPALLDHESLLGDAYRQKGMLKEALVEYERATKSLGRTSVGYIITLHALGRNAEALALLRDLENGWPKKYLAPELLAGARARLGDFDAAVKWLDKGLALRSSALSSDGMAYDLEPLRGFPPYESLLRRLNMPDHVDMR